MTVCECICVKYKKINDQLEGRVEEGGPGEKDSIWCFTFTEWTENKLGMIII